MVLGNRIPPPIIHIPQRKKYKLSKIYELPISPDNVVFLSKKLNVRRPYTFNVHRDILSPPNIDVAKQLPLHYIDENWAVLIYGIYLFNTLTPEQQQEEMMISAKLPHKDKQMYWQRRNDLMRNPLPPLISTNKNDIITDQVYTEYEGYLSTARSLARGNHITNSRRKSVTADAVTSTKVTTRSTINNNNPSKTKTTEEEESMITIRGLTYGVTLLNGRECTMCGYQYEPSIKKKAQLHTYADYNDTPALKCIQCIEGLNQDKLVNQKNNDLLSVYSKQLLSQQKCIESQQVMIVNIQDFLIQQLPSIDATSDLLKLFHNVHSLTSSVIQLKQHYPTINEFNSMQTRISGATWNDDESNPHPNILMHCSQTADMTIVKLPGRSKKEQQQQKQQQHHHCYPTYQLNHPQLNSSKLKSALSVLN